MADQVSTLALAVDSTGVDNAAKALDRMAVAGKGAESAASALDKVSASARSASTSTAAIAESTRATAGGFNLLSASADKASHASSGMTRELIVLAHELSQGNTTRFGGSLLVLAEYSSKAQTAIAALLGPVGATIAALAAFGIAAAAGGRESAKLADALILTGDASGATYSGLNNAAKGISAIAGTRGAAAEALTAIASTGAVAGVNLEKFGLVAVKLSRDVGVSVEETAKQFEELGKSPVEASTKLNESLHYLTLSTYEQIKSFQDQGKEADAASAAQNAYADAMLNRTAQIEGNLGTLSHAWHVVMDAAKGAWDSMLNIGRADSIQDRLSAVTKAVDQSRATLAAQQDTNVSAQTDKNRKLFAAGKLQDQLAEQASLTRQALLEDNVATSAKAAADKVQSRIGFDKLVEDSLDRQAKKEKEITKARTLGASAGASPDEIQKQIAAINEKYKDPKGSTPRNTDRSTINEDLGAYKDALSSKLDAYRNSQSLFDAQRAAGLKADQDYYDQERVQLELYEAANLKEIDQAIARRKAQTFSGPEAQNNEINNAREINKLQTERAKVMADTKAASDRLDTQEKSANQRRLAGYLANDLAAQRAYEQTQKQYDLDLAVAKMGPQESAQYQARLQIANKYASDLQALNDKKATQQKAGTFNADAKADYDADLSRIQMYQEKSLSSYDAYYERRKQQDADYQVGLGRATATYIENAQDVAKLTEQAYTNTFSSIEDALVGFATTGKLNFKSLADSIIADFIRIEVKQQESKLLQSISGNAGGIGSSYSGSLLGSLVGLFTGGGYSANGGLGYATAAGISGGRASGGDVSAGNLYQVNERGPELLQSGGKQYLMMGSKGGNVVPNGGQSTNASGGVKIDQSRQTINVGQGVSRGEMAAAVRQGNAATEQRIRRLLKNGNIGA